jgi:hypothetical protein
VRADVLGVAERGNSADGPLNRESGTGWVAASAKHDYAAATASHCSSPTTGALSSEVARMLRALDKQSRLSTTHDSTCYGESSASPQFFYAHHCAAISYAIVRADAGTILDKRPQYSRLGCRDPGSRDCFVNQWRMAASNGPIPTTEKKVSNGFGGGRPRSPASGDSILGSSTTLSSTTLSSATLCAPPFGFRSD